MLIINNIKLWLTKYPVKNKQIKMRLTAKCLSVNSVAKLYLILSVYTCMWLGQV